MSDRICRLSGIVAMIACTTGWAQSQGAPSRLPSSISAASQVPAPPSFQPVIPERGDSPNPLEVKVSGPPTAMANQEFECQVVVTNRGAMPIVKAGMKIWSTPGIKLAEGSKPARPPFSLNPGDTITVPLRAASTQSGTQGIKVEISADGTWKKVVETLIEVRKSQLKVELTGVKEMKPQFPGDYSIVVTNAGDMLTRDTFVFLELPEGWEMISSFPAAIWVPEQRYAYWALGDFAAGQRFRYQMRLKSTRQGVGEIRASAKDAGNAWGESIWFTKADSKAADPPQTPAPLPTTLPAGGNGSAGTNRRTLPQPVNISSSRKSIRR